MVRIGYGVLVWARTASLRLETNLATFRWPNVDLLWCGLDGVVVVCFFGRVACIGVDVDRYCSCCGGWGWSKKDDCWIGKYEPRVDIVWGWL